MIIVLVLSFNSEFCLKYLKSRTLDIGIYRKSEFVAKTQFYCNGYK